MLIEQLLGCCHPVKSATNLNKTSYMALCSPIVHCAGVTSQRHLRYLIAIAYLLLLLILLLLLPLLLLQVSVGGVTSVSLPGLVGLGPLVTLQQVEVGPGPAEKSFLQASTVRCAVLCRAVPCCAVHDVP
jgi:prepilin signal peptidase PulO-like enzyme (type II secretory pathway)